VKRLLLIVAVAIAAGTVGVLAPSSAKAAVCNGDLFDAGYDHTGIPAVGSSIAAHVGNFGGSIYSSSSEDWLDGYVGVSDLTNNAWIEAGVLNDTSKLFHGVRFSQLPTAGYVQYVAYQMPPSPPVLDLFQTAKLKAYYNTSITQVAAGNWTAKSGSNVVTDIPVSMPSGNSTFSNFIGSTFNSGASTCNVMDFQWNSLSPWSTTAMSRITSGPYDVVSMSGNDGFTAIGG
jgi:hypothetical protein